MMACTLRQQVLRKYREVLRLSTSWNASEEAETAVERRYIKQEARTLFRKNKPLTDTADIGRCLEEATTRVEMALHYKNPYPRPVNFPPGYVVASRHKKTQLRRSKDSEPLYTHSLDK